MGKIPDIICEPLKCVGGVVKSLIIDRMEEYVNYIRHCGQNLDTLRGQLERLHLEKLVIDREVMRGRERLKIINEHTTLWLKSVHEFTREEDLKELMIKDIKLAKVALKLMQVDLKNLIESNCEIRDIVVDVLEDITQRKELVGKGKKLSEEEISIAETDKEVAKVLEKLMVETIEGFKDLMKKDEKMAVAAGQLLEDLEDFNKLLEKDKEMAVIIKGSEGMSYEQELLQMNENAFRSAVRSLLRPVGELMLNEKLLQSLPENVRLGVTVMGVVIGNCDGWMAEVDAENNTLRRTNCCHGCASFVNHFRDRRDMSVAAENMINKIKCIMEGIPARPLTRPLARAELEAIPTYAVGLESRKVLLQNIVVALTDANVNVVAAHGMGGSGKTTLGKEIANNKAHGTFDRVVMVEISETPNIERIQDQIGDGLGLSLDRAHGISQKAILLYNRLKSEGNKNDVEGKKTLVILDNIWHEFDLNEVGIPREYCKILLTSRERDVCKLMDVEDTNIFNVGLLNEIEAKYLFQYQVRKDVDSEEFKSVADRLLEKCGGLPLSIVTTANSLKGKDLPLWLKFVDELEKPISCQVSGALRETFKILRTSYEFIESEEKKIFFLLACLSPLGSSISILDVMRYGIGLDLFQHANKLSEAIEQAHGWAEELVSSSMLLEGDSKEYIKIHDVVRECTMSFVSKGDRKKGGHMFLVDVIPRWISKETFNQYTGISLLSGVDYSCLSGVKAELLHILLLKGNVDYKSPDSNFFQGMTNLKVLAMSAMNFEEGLPESMGKLKDLKTLHLESCRLGDIKLIGKLESLLVLSLRGSTLEGIPDDIGMLSKLRLLDMGKCICRLPTIPANVIDRLSHLEGLYLLHSSFKEWANSDGLNKLGSLNILEMRVPYTCQLPSQAQFVEKLDKFEIHVGPLESWMYPMDFELATGAYIPLRFQLPERVVTIAGVNASGNWSNNWLKKVLKKADYLNLESFSIKNVVPEVFEEGFSDLSYLYLYELHKLQRICEGTAPSGLFSNLRHLQVFGLNQLQELLYFNILPRKLITLKITECWSLRFLFSKNNNASLQSDMDTGVNQKSHVIELPDLESLKLNCVESLISVAELSCVDDTEDQCFFNTKVIFPSLKLFELRSNLGIVKLWGKESNIHSFRNLKEMQLEDCGGLQSLGPPSIVHALVQLEKLEIRDCKMMQEVISKETGEQEIHEEMITFPKLKCLLIFDCWNLKCFYGGSYKMDFPRLQRLEFRNVWRMTKFGVFENSTAFSHKEMGFPCLELLELKDVSSEVTELWDWHSSLTEGIGCSVTSNPVPESRNLKRIISLHPFHSLSTLHIRGLNWKYVFSADSGLEQLQSLEEIIISCCQNLEAVIQTGDRLETVLFPSLKTLQLESLQPLRKFSSRPDTSLHFPSLEILKVISCYRLEALCTGAFSAPKLQEVEVWNCDELQWFINAKPNDVVAFPLLRDISIRDCVAMKSFSSEPLITHHLRNVEIHYCPKMEWVLLGNTNHGADLELPSLEYLTIEKCGNMKSFSPAVLKAPRLSFVVFDDKHYSISEIGDLNQFLKTRYASSPNVRSLSKESHIRNFGSPRWHIHPNQERGRISNFKPIE